MRDSELAILFNALGEILDNQNEIMKHLGIKKYDPNNYGYYDNKTENIAANVFLLPQSLKLERNEYMKVIRYSIYGFKPQEQTHHMKYINYHLNEFNINEYPEHLRYEIQKIHERYVKFYLQHLDDLKCGIWCFIDGYKDNLSLNHLKRKVPCWEAELPDNIEYYDCNWERFITISDPIIMFGGCYIPKR